MKPSALIERYIEPAQPRVFNPDFVRRVHAKRRMEAEKAAIAEHARKEAERAEQWRRTVENRRRQAEEIEAQEHAEAMKDAPPSVRSIIARIEVEYGLPEGSIVSGSRKAPVVKARFEAMARAREARPDLSLPALGRIFQKDHTTLIHALRKMGVQTRRSA